LVLKQRDFERLFQNGVVFVDDYLKSHDQDIVKKWRKYLQLKEAFYKSYVSSKIFYKHRSIISSLLEGISKPVAYF